MNFKDFEGVKRIRNNNNITLVQVFDLLENYREELDEILLDEQNSNIIVDIDGKYNILIKFRNEEIIIERKLDEGCTETNKNYFETGKSVLLAQADRMIEQLYDLINDYIVNGIVKEHITKPKNILRMTQKDKTILKGALAIGTQFLVTDEDSNKEIYEITQKPINKLFSLNNLRIKREEAILNYSDINENRFLVLRHPFENIVITLEQNAEKRTFTSVFSTKKLKVTADYSNNHYLVEINEIVIGAIDCLDPLLKLNYRIEVNNMEYEFLLVAIAVIVDLYSNKNKEGI